MVKERKREQGKGGEEGRKGKRKVKRGGTYGYFVRGMKEGNDDGAFEVKVDKKPKLTAVTKAVKSFQYGKALTTALRTRNVKEVTAVTEELWARDGLTTAVAGRTTEEVEEIFQFVCRYVGHPGYGRTVGKLAEKTIEVYGEEKGEDIREGFRRVREKVREGIKEAVDAGGVMGEIQCRRGV